MHFCSQQSGTALLLNMNLLLPGKGVHNLFDFQYIQEVARNLPNQYKFSYLYATIILIKIC